MSKILTLWFPELLAPNKIDAAHEDSEFIWPKLPNLSHLLSKGDLLLAPQKNFYEQACNLCHQPDLLPIAAVTAQFDFDYVDVKQFWLRIDPVRLVPDRDNLVLFSASQLGLSRHDATLIIESFNKHFAEDKVQIELGSTNRWYLKIKQPVDLHTTPLSLVSGRSISESMPTGNASKFFKKLINEAQMLFYTHPVNEARRDQGLPEINSLWVWGEGTLSTQQLQDNSMEDWCLYTNHCYLKGIAKLKNAQYQEVPANFKQWQATSPPQYSLIQFDKQNISLIEWQDYLQMLDDKWFSEIIKSLKNGELSSVLLEFGANKRFHITPKNLKRFWRFNKSFQNKI